MKPGGYRKVRVSPHLAYRDQGLTDFIPPNAVLIVELWLRELIPASRAILAIFGSGSVSSAIIQKDSSLPFGMTTQRSDLSSRTLRNTQGELRERSFPK